MGVNFRSSLEVKNAVGNGIVLDLAEPQFDLFHHRVRQIRGDTLKRIVIYPKILHFVCVTVSAIPRVIL